MLESPKSEELRKRGLKSSVQSVETDEEPNILSADSLESSNVSLQTASNLDNESSSRQIDSSIQSNLGISIEEKESTIQSKSEVAKQEDSTIQNKSLVSVNQEETLHSNSKISTDLEITLQDKLEVYEPNQNDASPTKSEQEVSERISEQLEKSPTSAKLGSASEYENEAFEDKNSDYSKQIDVSQKSSAKTSDLREDSLEDYSKKSSTGTSIKSEKFLASTESLDKFSDQNVELSGTKEYSTCFSVESNKLNSLTESLGKSTSQNIDFPDATKTSAGTSILSQKSLKENIKLLPSSEESSIESLQKTLDQDACSPISNETINRSSESSNTSINSEKKSETDECTTKPSDSNQIMKSPNSSPRSSKSLQENSSNTSNSSEILEKSLDNSGSLEENKVMTGMDDTNVKGIKYVDVFKRVSEILADMTSPRSDKSPRVQDLYTTTYDIVGTSSENTSESGSC